MLMTAEESAEPVSKEWGTKRANKLDSGTLSNKPICRQQFQLRLCWCGWQPRKAVGSLHVYVVRQATFRGAYLCGSSMNIPLGSILVRQIDSARL